MGVEWPSTGHRLICRPLCMLLFVSSFEVNKNASYRKRCARVSADTVSFMLNFS